MNAAGGGAFVNDFPTLCETENDCEAVGEAFSSEHETGVSPFTTIASPARSEIEVSLSSESATARRMRGLVTALEGWTVRVDAALDGVISAPEPVFL